MDKTTISIDSNLYRLVEKSAKEHHVSIQSLIERALSVFVASPGSHEGETESPRLIIDGPGLNDERPNYIISPRIRRLMGVAQISSEEVERDERLRYLLSK